MTWTIRQIMTTRRSKWLLPLIYTNLVFIFLPVMYCQLLVACQGVASGLSTIQIALLFCNGPVLMSFLGVYCKDQFQGCKMDRILCISTAHLAGVSALLYCAPFNGGVIIYLLWMILLTWLSVSCFFSQLACFAVLSKYHPSSPPNIMVLDTAHAISAILGMGICYNLHNLVGLRGLLLFSSALLSFPPALIWLFCVVDAPSPPLFINDIEETCSLCDDESIKTYFNDERLKSDLVKDNPYLLMENEGFAKNLIDTDAQVIILVNIIYTVTVAVCQGVHCFFLMSLSQRTEMFTVDKCCFVYVMGTVLSTALCTVTRPYIVHFNTCNKVVAIAYLSVTTVTSLFLISYEDVYMGKCILCYCTIVSNCQLLEEVIESVVTSYYDSIYLPAMRSFPIRDYINSKVGFFHSVGSLVGCLVFGIIAGDTDMESLFFTVAAIFTTVAVVTTPMSLLFVTADLR